MLWNATRTAPSTAFAPPDDFGVQAFLELAHTVGVPRRSGRALQLGGASRELSELLASHFDEYIGIDPDAVAVRRAKRTPVGRRPNVRFFVGDDARPDEFEGDPFDLVVCDFNRIPAGRDVLRRMGGLMRLLAPGGIALFDVPRRPGIISVLRNRGAHCGSVSVSWPEAANEARLARARIMWVDKKRPAGTLYCIARGD